MPIELNHTIVYVKDQEAASTFLTELFDLPAATRFGPFHVVEVDNGVSLDYISTDQRFARRRGRGGVGEQRGFRLRVRDRRVAHVELFDDGQVGRALMRGRGLAES